MREMSCSYGSLRILYSEIGYCERKKRKLQWVFCRLYPFISWIIIKEGPGNLFGGCSPHWVNHVYLSLLSFVFYFHICFALLLCDPIFLTTGIREKGNSQEKRVPGSSGRNDGIWKV
jgi:hypothetical protein